MTTSIYVMGNTPEQVAELCRWLTDHYTADLYRTDNIPHTDYVIFPISRIICDVERLLNDPLEECGLGITSDLSINKKLKYASFWLINY